MALVIMRDRAGTSFLHRHAGLGAVERSDLALLVSGENEGFVRRIEIEADDVGDLVVEMGIARELEAPRQMR